MCIVLWTNNFLGEWWRHFEKRKDGWMTWIVQRNKNYHVLKTLFPKLLKTGCFFIEGIIWNEQSFSEKTKEIDENWTVILRRNKLIFLNIRIKRKKWDVHEKWINKMKKAERVHVYQQLSQIQIGCGRNSYLNYWEGFNYVKDSIIYIKNMGSAHNKA